ncbi:hypothetical protein CCMA1212_010266 [Trichoderma ghanense]|uniref:Uncharacterized protein n=1 Tax=Trichoderma ghanense TaxID=65468 RepID=A0ABY2GRZ6_9HYPO
MSSSSMQKPRQRAPSSGKYQHQRQMECPASNATGHGNPCPRSSVHQQQQQARKPLNLKRQRGRPTATQGVLQGPKAR